MRRAVVAGIVTSVVGYTSAFAIVLAGLQGVGVRWATVRKAPATA